MAMGSKAFDAKRSESASNHRVISPAYDMPIEGGTCDNGIQSYVLC